MKLIHIFCLLLLSLQVFCQSNNLIKWGKYKKIVNASGPCQPNEPSCIKEVIRYCDKLSEKLVYVIEVYQNDKTDTLKMNFKDSSKSYKKGYYLVKDYLNNSVINPNGLIRSQLKNKATLGRKTLNKFLDRIIKKAHSFKLDKENIFRYVNETSLY